MNQFRIFLQPVLLWAFLLLAAQPAWAADGETDSLRVPIGVQIVEDSTAQPDEFSPPSESAYEFSEQPADEREAEPAVFPFAWDEYEKTDADRLERPPDKRRGRKDSRGSGRGWLRYKKINKGVRTNPHPFYFLEKNL